MFVKICGVTNEDDALLAVAMGADAIGFVFAPSPRQVHPEVVRDILKRLPHDTLTIGVFRNETPERVIDIIGRERADVVLVDSPEPGSGDVFDWSLAEGAPDGVRLLLAGGLNPDNVEQA